MDQTDETEDAPVLCISRTFKAPVALVFAAWIDAEQLRQWFSPLAFSIPVARVEPKVGGVYEWCMRNRADGTQHWTRGVIQRLDDCHRLEIEMKVGDDPEHPLFTASTTVVFTRVADGTRVDVEQRYRAFDPAARAMFAGAPEGWRQTLDRLASVLTTALETGHR